MNQRYLRWEEVQVSGDKGRRIVHYYLKDVLGNSDLAVIGREKTLRHITYDVSNSFLNRLRMISLMSSASPSYAFPIRLRSRREVVDWLTSIISDSPNCSSDVMNRFLDVDDDAPKDFSVSKDLSQKTKRHSKDFSWSESSWTCKKRRNHYTSFCRNGITISVYDFVHVMGENNRRLVAYVEDLYEDMKSNHMVSVRWFHKVDEVRKIGIALPPDTHSREIFFTLCLQDLSVECIDGLVSVFSTNHFAKYIKVSANMTREFYLCRRKIDNDDIRSFDITQVLGYQNQELFKYMDTTSTTIHPKMPSCFDLDQTGNEYNLHCMGKRKDWSAEDGFDTFKNKRGPLLENNGHVNGCLTPCLPRKEAYKQKLQQNLHVAATETFKKKCQQHFLAGSQVEVLSQDSGIRGCWFRGVVVKKHKDRIKVRYTDIQDADGDGLLEEWLLAFKIAKFDNRGIRLSGRTMIRPRPSSTCKVSSYFNVGSVVDAWWHDGWWEGIVFHRESDHKIHVYFSGENQIAIFDQGELRHSQEWIHNKWYQIKEPNHVSLALSNQKLEKDGCGGNIHLAQSIPLTDRNLGTQPGEGGLIAAEGRSPCDDNHDTCEKITNEEKSVEKAQSLHNFKWGIYKRRSKTCSNKGSHNLLKKQCINHENVSDDSKKVDDPSACFQFSITKSLTNDLDNCKVGDMLFNKSLEKNTHTGTSTSTSRTTSSCLKRMSIDCDCCYRKIRRALLKMQELESHLIERKQCRVSVCGTFIPQEVAIRMRKTINRRVEILSIKEVDVAVNSNNTEDVKQKEEEEHTTITRKRKARCCFWF